MLCAPESSKAQVLKKLTCNSVFLEGYIENLDKLILTNKP